MRITEHKTQSAIEYNVIDGNIELRQIALNDGTKFNEATKDGEFISIHSDEVKPLFIALNNFKNLSA